MKNQHAHPGIAPQDRCLLACRQLFVGPVSFISLDNPLLKKAAEIVHTWKSDAARALGAPHRGRNFIYVHLNRVIQESTILICSISLVPGPRPARAIVG